MNKYFIELNKIRKRYNELWKPKCCPYTIYDWIKIFTPIEKNVWSDIRYLSLPFYPQYPVDKYFLDFADPVKKIGIEVDGKEFHKNIIKDKKRQDKIEKLGWNIIRIPGWKTFKEYDNYFTEEFYDNSLELEEIESEEFDEKNKKYTIECSEGILRKIKIKFYL